MQVGRISFTASVVCPSIIVAVCGRHLGRRDLRGIRIPYSLENRITVCLQTAWSAKCEEIHGTNCSMIACPGANLMLMHPLQPGDRSENWRDIAPKAWSEILYGLVALPVVIHCSNMGEWTGKKPVVRRNVHFTHHRIHERVVHRTVAVDGRDEIRRTDQHPSADDILLGAIDRQLGADGTVRHIVEPPVIVGKLTYRLAPEAGVEIALPHSSDDHQPSIG